MGTRADFYVGVGPDAEWLGSIAFDGYPSGVFHDDICRDDCLHAGHGDEQLWREDVADFLASRDDATLPERGWPWPWENSARTDYAYAYDPERQQVLGSSFGGFWFIVAEDEPTDDEGDATHDVDRDGIGRPTFPVMSERQNVRFDRGSGAIHITRRPDGSVEVSG